MGLAGCGLRPGKLAGVSRRDLIILAGALHTSVLELMDLGLDELVEWITAANQVAAEREGEAG